MVPQRGEQVSYVVWIITTDVTKPMFNGPANYHLDVPMQGPVKRMDDIFQIEKRAPSPHPDWLIFVHDDVDISDVAWQSRFTDTHKEPNVAIVGLGGAIGIGTADIYKTPYHIHQLARQNYSSNQTDYQIHGTLETGVKKVAVVDGFFLAIRWKFLEEIGGFSWMKTRFHCYDLALCLEAYRRGWEVRMIGLSCTHHGGRTSTTPEYVDWCTAQGTTPALEHSQPHVWLYDRYRDLLPFHV